MAKDRIIVGIDIGSSKITTLIASVAEEMQPSIIGVSTVKSKGIKKSQVVDIVAATKSVISSLEAAERMAGYQVNSAFVSIGGVHIGSINSQGVVAVANPNGEITESDVERAVEGAKAISLPSTQSVLHVLPRQFTVDSQAGIKDPVGMTGVRLEVDTHLVTGGTTSIRNLRKCVEEVGIDVDGLVFNGLASSESVLTDTEKELGVVLVDIGAGSTDFCVWIEGSLSYSTVVPVGAGHITNDLAIGLRVSLESAEKIKLYLSNYSKDQEKHEKKPKGKKTEDKIDIKKLNLVEGLREISFKTVIEGIIRPRLNEIFELIGKELAESGFGALTPAGVVLTGGGAETVSILDSAKRVLAMPARSGNPNNVRGLIDEIIQPSYSTSVGLILYGSASEIEEKMFSFDSFGQVFKRFQIKGVAGRTIDLLKSFLP
jgi:cell division protein FtsA